MALSSSSFAETLQVLHASQPSDTKTSADKLLNLLDDSKDLLFQGKEDVQPIKIYQVGRIYRLARICIEMITLLWPVLKYILFVLKKI